ncbi:hypothetical protein DXG01_008093 [Tephrocybe rancida]|nr:hypothetical protein DXG01_008093 [Tephrocybe rancida]
MAPGQGTGLRGPSRWRRVHVQTPENKVTIVQYAITILDPVSSFHRQLRSENLTVQDHPKTHSIPTRAMQVARENLDSTIQTLLSYNPDPIQQNSDPDIASQRLETPISFYSFHVDDRLSLNRISPWSSITADLANTVDRTFGKIKDDGVVLPTANSSSLLRKSRKVKYVNDGKAVADVYKLAIADYVNSLASMLSLHPTAPWWTSSLVFDRCQLPSHNQHPGNHPLYENFTLSFREEPDDDSSVPVGPAWDTIENSRREAFEEAFDMFPQLATFHFYCGGGGCLSQGLDDMAKYFTKPFNPNTNVIAPGWPPSTIDLPFRPDAINTAWGPTVASLDRRRSSRIAAKNRSRATNKPRWSKIRVWEGKMHDLGCISRQMLQHAWARAIEIDATFIVINCANHERIGFRHRESQTLFLSEVIDITKCSEPTYTKLHLGLYISIIEDTLDRTRQVMDKAAALAPPDAPAETPPQVSAKKRKREDDEPPINKKRPRTRACLAKNTARKQAVRTALQDISEEVQGRRMALVRVQYLQYNSPAPACFMVKSDSVAIDKNEHDPHQYFFLTLTSPLGDGSTGHAHSATLELLGRDGKVRTFSNAVVKLAKGLRQLRHMQNEYEVYLHLQKSGVHGIPHLFGLYHDFETDTSALVMSSVGEGLWHRPLKRSGHIRVSPAEREGFIEILKSIHAAGVRHRDVRVLNMAVKDDGAVSIFDFDMAMMDASEASREREMAHLIALLDGEELPYAAQETLATPDVSRDNDDPVEVDWDTISGVAFEDEECVATQLR